VLYCRLTPILRPTAVALDQDLREYQQEMALAGLDRKNTSNGSRLVGTAKFINRKTRGNIHFELEEEELQPPRLDESDESDELLAYALQESMESGIAKVKSPSTSHGETLPDLPPASTSQKETMPEDDFYTDSPPASRLEWALAFANSGPSRSHSTPSKTPSSSLFGKPSLLASPTNALTSPPEPAKAPLQPTQGNPPLTINEVEQDNLKSQGSSVNPSLTISFVPSGILLRNPEKPPDTAEPHRVFPNSDEEMEEVPVNLFPTEYLSSVQIDAQSDASFKSPPRLQLDLGILETGHSTLITSPAAPLLRNQDEDQTEEPLFAWSRTPSPSLEIDEGHPSPAEEWDAADEIDVHAEEGEFARFMSQMKGKNLDDVRNEIDDEIKGLNQRRKAAIRDSEDITQQMIAQIMVTTPF